MRPDLTLLQDMVAAADAMEQFTRGMTADWFADAEMVKSAVVDQIIIIGEAANRLSPELRNRHPHVRWRGIIG